MDKKPLDSAAKAKPKPSHPTPYGTKAENNKGKKVQAAYQKKNNSKGR